MDIKDIDSLANDILDEKDKLKKLIDDEVNPEIKLKNILEYNNILDIIKEILYTYVKDRISQIKEKVPNDTEESLQLIKDFNNAYQIYIINIDKQYIRTEI
tara:strand:+ start:255 stop:557 length:303 start_codon:yes stop_codon:yes gene_type:complete